MTTRPSLPSLWRIYKRPYVVTGTGGKRDLAITQLAFYSGARGVLRVLAHLIEQGEYEATRDNPAARKADPRRLRAKRH